MPTSSRRQELLSDYHFLCVCPRCESDKEEKVSYPGSNKTIKGMKPNKQKKKTKKEKK